MKALAAHKHVLLEKPSSDSQMDTVKMFQFAEQKGLVLLEAFHYRSIFNNSIGSTSFSLKHFTHRFHPAIQRVKAILDSGELGKIKSIKAELCVPKGLISLDDIRYKYDLGGGGFMDGGGDFPYNVVHLPLLILPHVRLCHQLRSFPDILQSDTNTFCQAYLDISTGSPDRQWY